MKNMGDNLQRASADAHAAYLLAIRWFVSGDESFARRAIEICDAWSATVELVGIPIGEFALAAEVLRACPLWEESRFRYSTASTTGR
jgi:hypothetical protein